MSAVLWARLLTRNLSTDLLSVPCTGLGSIRTATKRAGGTVANHGGSPGKRLGVKKFSGVCRFVCTVCSPLKLNCCQMSMLFLATSLFANAGPCSTQANTYVPRVIIILTHA